MNILFITSVAVVAAEPQAVHRCPRSPVGGRGRWLLLQREHPGSKHFGVWPLSEAAEACFRTREWPADRKVPQASIEFEVEDAEAVAAAGFELQRAGFELLHQARREPWGQTVTRLLTQDGLILGISYAPSSTSKRLPERAGRCRPRPIG